MDSDLLEEKEKFASDKEFFDEQRVGLENERKQLTDAAIKLGHEVRSVQTTFLLSGTFFKTLYMYTLYSVSCLRMED